MRILRIFENFKLRLFDIHEITSFQPYENERSQMCFITLLVDVVILQVERGWYTSAYNCLIRIRHFTLNLGLTLDLTHIPRGRHELVR
ncbi:hypothetical protein EDD53_1722 [Pacificibacter maritimus]|uniref:Uncharacterized protein n=1 Tax=Pacificibacter maritimus TaxID=762213 RepID=A0A3N4U998_9RHOB|nr:hypothetical protein EDD53_1722 [Pacificibacter maritimus]